MTKEFDYGKTGKCCLCGGNYEHWGNNPAPIKKYEEGRCCDKCNHTKVLPTRIKLVKMKKEFNFREELAELEHEQWLKWSSYVANNNKLPKELLDKWGKNWKPYSELNEKTKDSDRVWADKVLVLFEQWKKEAVKILKEKSFTFGDTDYYEKVHLGDVNDLIIINIKDFNKIFGKKLRK